MRRRAEVRRYDSREEANRGAADRFAELARQAVEDRGRFLVALSGGPEPQEMHRLLAGEPFRSAVPWGSVHVFFGDERMVPPRHPRSNFRLASESLLDHIRLPDENIHRMAGELPPEDARDAYERELLEVSGQEAPVFDLIHLGVGADGHTASLFPFQTEVLYETARPVNVAFDRDNREIRLTLTLPVINRARAVDFLTLEGEKAAMVRQVTRGALDPVRLPAQFVHAVDSLTWHLSPAAAEQYDR